jgi:hypothetical protein
MRHIQLQANQVAAFGTVALALLVRQGFTVDIMRDDLPIDSYFQPLQATSQRQFSNLEYIDDVISNLPFFYIGSYYNLEHYVPVRGVRVRLGKDIRGFNEAYPVVEIIDCL